MQRSQGQDVSHSYDEDEEGEKDNVLYKPWCSSMDGESCEDMCAKFVHEINKCHENVYLRKSFLGNSG